MYILNIKVNNFMSTIQARWGGQMYQEAVVEDGSRAVECSGSREEEGQETESHGGNVWRAQWLIQPRVVVWFCAKQCAALRIALHCHLRMRS